MNETGVSAYECFAFSGKMEYNERKQEESTGLSDLRVRFWQPSDVPDLREIFSVSFGDPPEMVSAFHDLFLTAPESCMLAAVQEEESRPGRPVAAAYCLPGSVLAFRERRIPSVYLYAFACLPAWRGQGIMKRVYTALFAEACRQAPCACMVPASDGLMQAYNRSGFVFSPLGSIRSARMTGVGSAVPLPAAALSWQDYARRRESCLAPYPHAVYPDAWYRLMAAYGTVFLSLPGALAAASPLQDRVLVQELLCPSADPGRALAGVAAACPAGLYEVRTPAFFPGPGEMRPYAWLHAAEESVPRPADFWYPFALE